MSFMRRTLLHGVTQHKLTHKLQKPPMDPTFSQPNFHSTSVTLLWLCSSVACCWQKYLFLWVKIWPIMARNISPYFWTVMANLMEDILLCLLQYSKANLLLTVKYNYSSLFRQSYVFQLLTAIIEPPIQYPRVRQSGIPHIYSNVCDIKL